MTWTVNSKPRRLLSALLALVMCVGLLPVTPAVAATKYTMGIHDFTIKDDGSWEVTITSSGSSTDGYALAIAPNFHTKGAAYVVGANTSDIDKNANRGALTGKLDGWLVTGDANLGANYVAIQGSFASGQTSITIKSSDSIANNGEVNTLSNLNTLFGAASTFYVGDETGTISSNGGTTTTSNPTEFPYVAIFIPGDDQTQVQFAYATMKEPTAGAMAKNHDLKGTMTGAVAVSSDINASSGVANYSLSDGVVKVTVTGDKIQLVTNNPVTGNLQGGTVPTNRIESVKIKNPDGGYYSGDAIIPGNGKEYELEVKVKTNNTTGLPMTTNDTPPYTGSIVIKYYDGVDTDTVHTETIQIDIGGSDVTYLTPLPNPIEFTYVKNTNASTAIQVTGTAKIGTSYKAIWTTQTVNYIKIAGSNSGYFSLTDVKQSNTEYLTMTSNATVDLLKINLNNYPGLNALAAGTVITDDLQICYRINADGDLNAAGNQPNSSKPRYASVPVKITVIDAASLTLSAADLATAYTGTTYADSGYASAPSGLKGTASATNNTGTVTYGVTTATDNGLTLHIDSSSGQYYISGTPTMATNASFELTATDSTTTAKKTITVTVAQAKVTAAALTITAPVDGAAVSTTATATNITSTPTGVADGDIAKTVAWTTGGSAATTFANGSDYKVAVTLTPPAGYTMDTSGTYTLNGQSATLTDNGNGTYTLELTYTAYKLTYDNGGRTGATLPSPNPVYAWDTNGVSHDWTLSATTPTFSGYTFNKWATTTGQTSGTYAEGATYTATSTDATLYAAWTQDTTYTITYLPGSAGGVTPAGTTVATAGIPVGGTGTLAANGFSTPAGYEFDGWLVDNGFGKKAAGATVSPVNANLTATAQWKAKGITLVASSDQSAEYGHSSAMSITWTATSYDSDTVTFTVTLPADTSHFNSGSAAMTTTYTKTADASGVATLTIDEINQATTPWVSGGYPFTVTATSSNGQTSSSVTKTFTITKKKLDKPTLTKNNDASGVGVSDGQVTVGIPSTPNWPDNTNVELFQNDGTTSVGGPWTYSGGQLGGAATQAVSGLGKGTYKVKAIAPNTNYEDSDWVTATIDEPSTVTITYRPGDDGLGTAAGGVSQTATVSTSGTTNLKSLSSLGFTAPAGYRFKEWTITDTDGTSDPVTVTSETGGYAFKKPRYVTAQWEKIPIKITPPSNVTVTYGTTIASSALTWNVTDDKNATWVGGYTVNFVAQNNSGSPTIDAAKWNYTENTSSVTIAEVNSGATAVGTYTFYIKVTSDEGHNTDRTYVGGPFTVTINQQQLKQPTLTPAQTSIKDGADGSVTVSWTAGDYPDNTVIEITGPTSIPSYSTHTTPSTQTFTITDSTATTSKLFDNLPAGVYSVVMKPADTANYTASAAKTTTVSDPGLFSGTVTVRKNGTPWDPDADGNTTYGTANGNYTLKLKNVDTTNYPSDELTLTKDSATGVWKYSGGSSGQQYALYSGTSGADDTTIRITSGAKNAVLDFWTVTPQKGSYADTAEAGKDSSNLGGDGASQTFMNNEVATLVATPDTTMTAAAATANWTITGGTATGAATTNTNTTTVKMTGTVTATANYALAGYTALVTVRLNGTPTDVVSVQLKAGANGSPTAVGDAMSGSGGTAGQYKFWNNSNTLSAGTTYTHATVVTNSGSGGNKTYTAQLTDSIYYTTDLNHTTADIDLYTVTAQVTAPSPADGNTATVEGTTVVWAPGGAQLALASSAAANYKFNQWVNNGGNGTIAAATSGSTTYTVGTHAATLEAQFDGLPVITLTPTAASKTILQGTSPGAAVANAYPSFTVTNTGKGATGTLAIKFTDGAFTAGSTYTLASKLEWEAAEWPSNQHTSVAAGDSFSFDVNLINDFLTIGNHTVTMWVYDTADNTVRASATITLKVLQPVAAVPTPDLFTWDTYTETVTNNGAGSSGGTTWTTTIDLPDLETTGPIVSITMGSSLTLLEATDYTVGSVVTGAQISSTGVGSWKRHVDVTLTKSGIQKLADALISANGTSGTVTIIAMRDTNHSNDPKPCTVTINIEDTMPKLEKVTFDGGAIVGTGNNKTWKRGAAFPTYTVTRVDNDGSNSGALNGPVTYQWYVNGSALAGETNATLSSTAQSNLTVGQVVALEVRGTGYTLTDHRTTSPYVDAKPDGSEFYKRTVTVRDSFTVTAPDLEVKVSVDGGTAQNSPYQGITATGTAAGNGIYILSTTADATKYRWDSWRDDLNTSPISAGISAAASQSTFAVPTGDATAVANYLAIGHMSFGNGDNTSVSPTTASNQYTDTVTSDGAGTAYAVTLALDDTTNFSISPAAGSQGDKASGDTLPFTITPTASATPGQEYTIKVTVTYEEQSGETPKTIEQTIKYRVPLPTYTVKLTAPTEIGTSGTGGGTLKGNYGGVDKSVAYGGTTTQTFDVTRGDSVALTAIAEGGYKFVAWTRTSGSDTFGAANADSTLYGPVTANAEITGSFKPVSDLVEAHTVPNGSNITASLGYSTGPDVYDGGVTNSGAAAATITVTLSDTTHFEFDGATPTTVTASGGTAAIKVKAKTGLAAGTYSGSITIQETTDAADTMSGQKSWTIPFTFEVGGFDATVTVQLDNNGGTGWVHDATVELKPQSGGTSFFATAADGSHKYNFSGLADAVTYDVYVNGTKTDSIIQKTSNESAAVEFFTITLSTNPAIDNQPVATGVSAIFSGPATGFLKDSTVTVTAPSAGAISTTTYSFDKWDDTDTSTTTGGTTKNDRIIKITSASGMKGKALYKVAAQPIVKYVVIVDGADTTYGTGGSVTFYTGESYQDVLTGGAWNSTDNRYEVNTGAAFGMPMASASPGSGSYTVTPPTGYHFAGWTTKVGGSANGNYVFTAADGIANSSDPKVITLIPVWEKDDTLALANQVITGIYGHSVTLAAPGVTGGTATAFTSVPNSPILGLTINGTNGSVSGTANDVDTKVADVTVTGTNTDLTPGTTTATYTFVITQADVKPQGTLPTEVTIDLQTETADAAKVLDKFTATPANVVMDGDGTNETTIHGTWSVEGWTTATTPGDYYATLKFTPTNAGTATASLDHDDTKDGDHYKPYTTTVKVTVTAKLVTKVELNVTRPQVGQPLMNMNQLQNTVTNSATGLTSTPAGAKWATAGSHDNDVEITDVIWTPADANAVTGTDYTARVYLKIVDGSAYRFDGSLTGSELVTGDPANTKVETCNETVAVLSYKFKANTSVIDVSMSTLLVGKHPDEIAITVPGAHSGEYTLSNVKWYEKGGTTPLNGSADEFDGTKDYDFEVTVTKAGTTVYDASITALTAVNADATGKATVNEANPTEAPSTATATTGYNDGDGTITIRFSAFKPVNKKIVGLYVTGVPGAYYSQTAAADRHWTQGTTTATVGNKSGIGFKFTDPNTTRTLEVYPIYEGSTTPDTTPLTMGTGTNQYQVGKYDGANFTPVPATFKDYGNDHASNAYNDNTPGWDGAILFVKVPVGGSDLYAAVPGALVVKQLEADHIVITGAPTLSYSTAGTAFSANGTTAEVSFNSGSVLANDVSGLNYGHWAGTSSIAADLAAGASSNLAQNKKYVGMAASSTDLRNTFFYALDSDKNGQITDADDEIQNPTNVTLAMNGLDVYACYVDINGNLVYTKVGTLSVGELSVTITDQNGGDPEYGDILEATPAPLEGHTYTYQWLQEDNTLIPGATGKTYVPQKGDVGNKIRVMITDTVTGKHAISGLKKIEKRSLKFDVTVQNKNYDGDANNEHTYTAADFILKDIGSGRGGVYGGDSVTLAPAGTWNNAEATRPPYNAATVNSTITWPAIKTDNSSADKAGNANDYTLGAMDNYYRLVDQDAIPNRGKILAAGKVVHVDALFTEKPVAGATVAAHDAIKEPTQTNAEGSKWYTDFTKAGLTADPDAPTGAANVALGGTFAVGTKYTVVTKVSPNTPTWEYDDNTKFYFHFGSDPTHEVTKATADNDQGLYETGGKWYMYYSFTIAAAVNIDEVQVGYTVPVSGAHPAVDTYYNDHDEVELKHDALVTDGTYGSTWYEGTTHTGSGGKNGSYTYNDGDYTVLANFNAKPGFKFTNNTVFVVNGTYSYSGSGTGGSTTGHVAVAPGGATATVWHTFPGKDKTIVKVAANVDYPVAGNTLAGSQNIVNLLARNAGEENLLDKLNTTFVKWEVATSYGGAYGTESNTTFQPNRYYRATFTAEPTTDYHFLASGADYVDFLINGVYKNATTDPKVWINGADTAVAVPGDHSTGITVTTTRNSNDKYTITVDFPMTGSKADVPTVWAFTTPKANDTIMTGGAITAVAAITIPASEPYRIKAGTAKWERWNGTAWVAVSDGDTFLPGHSYKATLTAEIVDVTTHQFTDPTAGYINDTEAYVAAADDTMKGTQVTPVPAAGRPDTLTLARVFNIPKEKVVVHIESVIPVAGEPVATADASVKKVVTDTHYDLLDGGTTPAATVTARWYKDDGHGAPDTTAPAAADTNFGDGATYWLVAQVRARDGYELYDEEYGHLWTTNDNKITSSVTKLAGDVYQVAWKYTASSKPVITNVPGNAVAPATGVALNLTGWTNENFDIVEVTPGVSVIWTTDGVKGANEVTGTAQPNTTYTAKVQVRPKTTVNVDPAPTYFFNGNVLDPAGAGFGDGTNPTDEYYYEYDPGTKTYTLWYTFAETVKLVNIVPGNAEQPIYDAATPQNLNAVGWTSADFDVVGDPANNVTWYTNWDGTTGTVVNGLIQPDTVYTAVIRVTPKAGVTVTDDATKVFDGNNLTIGPEPVSANKKWDKSGAIYTLTYTFPKTGGDSTRTPIVNIDPPAKDNAPDTTAASPNNSVGFPLTGGVQNVTWYEGTTATGTPFTGTFASGKQYTVRIEVNPAGLDGISVFGNGDPLSFNTDNETFELIGGKLYVIHTWPALAGDPALTPVVNVTPPVKGATPENGVSPNNSVTVQTTTWTSGGNPVTGTFQPGTTYKVRINIATAKPDGTGNYAPGNTVQFNSGTKTILNDGGQLYIEAEWTVPTDPAGGGYPVPGPSTTITKEVPTEEPVVYYSVGEEGTTPDLTAEKVEKGSSPAAVPKITPVNFMKFKGWSEIDPATLKNGQTPTLVDPKTFVIEEDKIFYAVYEEIKIENADHGNYIIGFPNGTFGPDNYITRAQVATIVARACLEGFVEGKDYGNPGGYTDVSYHWAYSAISFCTLHHVMNGYLEDDGTYTFRPERYISRQELANVVARLKGVQTNQGMSFTDTAQIADWAMNGVYTTVANGWVDGYEEKDGTYTFRPERNITRAETVKIFNGYLDRGVDDKGLDGLKQYIHSGVASNNTENGYDEYMIWPDCLTHWAYYEIIEAANNHDFHAQDPDDADSLEDWDRVYIDEVWRYFDDSSDGADAVDRNNAAEEAARQAAAQQAAQAAAQAAAEEAARQAAAEEAARQAAAEEAARQAAAEEAARQAAAEEAARQAAEQQTTTTDQSSQTTTSDTSTTTDQGSETTAADTSAATDQSGETAAGTDQQDSRTDASNQPDGTTGNTTTTGQEPAEESNEVTVTYVVKTNGTVYASMTETVAKGGQPTQVPQAVPNEGYAFVGWSDVDPDSGNYHLVTPSQVTVSEDTTFFAVFETVQTTTGNGAAAGSDAGADDTAG